MAKALGVTRAEQDALAAHSHLSAAAAWQSGFHAQLVCPISPHERQQRTGRQVRRELAKLRTVFDTGAGGTMTAGNSTPLTDGAAAVLLASEDWARARNLPVQAYLTYAKTWAVDFASGHEGLLMAPAYAVSAMLRDANLGLGDFDFYELHEAFAAQVLCTLKAWESPQFCRERLGRDAPLGAIDRSKLNIKGSSIAYGHPFAATGARILPWGPHVRGTAERAAWLISVCTAGGMASVPSSSGHEQRRGRAVLALHGARGHEFDAG